MHKPADLLELLVSGIRHVLPRAHSLREALHADPRLGGDEGPTTAMVTQALPFVDWTPVAGTGAVGRVGPKGPAVGVRAELDALPILEKTGARFASRTRGVMHACGHDVHIAALWALMTAAHEVDLPVGLVGVLQPREEIAPSGAEDVVASGLLTEMDVQAMIGVHVQPRVRAGVLSTGVGGVNASFDEFTITVKGEPGHGAYPHLALDPISILATIVLGLSEIGARAIDPTHPSVISVGQISGGTAPNVIAGQASCWGTVRATTTHDRDLLHADIRRLARYTAAARGAKAEVEIVTGGPILDNNADLVAHIDPLVRHAGLDLAATPFRSCGSDDFAAYGAHLPSVMMFAGTGTISSHGDRHKVGLHHERFLPDEDAVERVARAMAVGLVGGTALVRESGRDAVRRAG